MNVKVVPWAVSRQCKFRYNFNNKQRHFSVKTNLSVLHCIYSYVHVGIYKTIFIKHYTKCRQFPKLGIIQVVKFP